VRASANKEPYVLVFSISIYSRVTRYAW